MGTTVDTGNLLQSLFGRTRCALLTLFFGRPDESFYVREVVRHARVGQGAVQRELDRLTACGLVRRQVRGRHVYYQANGDCPVFAELHGLVVKTAGVADVVRAALAPLVSRIRLAFVYGSVARGTANVQSDIDLMVVAEVSFGEVVAALKPAQEALAREVNPTVYSPEECRRKLAQGHHFLRTVWGEPKVFVVGSQDELVQLGGQWLADHAHDQPA
jgi:predicted nucleotidyltransferase